MIRLAGMSRQFNVTKIRLERHVNNHEKSLGAVAVLSRVKIVEEGCVVMVDQSGSGQVCVRSRHIKLLLYCSN